MICFNVKVYLNSIIRNNRKHNWRETDWNTGDHAVAWVKVILCNPSILQFIMWNVIHNFKVIILTISKRELKLSWSKIAVFTLYSASLISSICTCRLRKNIPTAWDLLLSNKWITCCFTLLGDLDETRVPSGFLATLANISAKSLTLIAGSSSSAHTVVLDSFSWLVTWFSCMRFQNSGFIGNTESITKINTFKCCSNTC